MTGVLAACTSSSAPLVHHSQTGVIAWTSAPVPPTTSSTTTTTTLAPAPLCTRSSLKVRLGPPLDGSGATVYVTNIGTTTCRLSGYASVMIVTVGGRHIQVPVRHRPQYADFPVVYSRATDLARGATGGFVLGGYSCGILPPSTTTTSGPATATSRVVLYLPHGEGDITYGAYVPWCPPRTPFWDSELGAFVPPPIHPLTLASTSISAPDLVKAGSVLHYSVMLGNPARQLSGLAPCPGYTEALAYAGSVHQYSYLLNCKAIEQLGSAKPATLAMQIRVPKLSRVEAATLTWRLDRPNSYPTLELYLTISSSPAPGSIHMTTTGTVVIPVPSRPTRTTTTTTPRNGNVISSIRGWLPVAYGDAQVSVPADFNVFYLDSQCSSILRPGTVLVGDWSASKCPPGSIQPGATLVHFHSLTRNPGSWRGEKPMRVNGLEVYLGPGMDPYLAGYGLEYQANDYIVPSLGIEVAGVGPLTKRIINTLSRSPRAVVLAAGAAPTVPSSWHRLSFTGIGVATPASWPVSRINDVEPDCGPSSEFGIRTVVLDTDQFEVPGGCVFAPPFPPTAPYDGVRIDRLATPLTSIYADHGCLILHGLRVCPATSPAYSILVLKVTVAGRSRPVYVSIGLAGNGMVARTILYSLRAA